MRVGNSAIADAGGCLDGAPEGWVAVVIEDATRNTRFE